VFLYAVSLHSVVSPFSPLLALCIFASQALAHMLFGPFFCCQLFFLYQKNVRPLLFYNSPSLTRQQPRFWSLHLQPSPRANSLLRHRSTFRDAPFHPTKMAHSSALSLVPLFTSCERNPHPSLPTIPAQPAHFVLCSPPYGEWLPLPPVTVARLLVLALSRPFLLLAVHPI
jgi:hypothetical protein